MTLPQSKNGSWHLFSMLLYLNDCFLNHETGYHPERAERLRGDRRGGWHVRGWTPAAAARRGGRSRGNGSAGSMRPAISRRSGPWPTWAAARSTPIPWSARCRSTWPSRRSARVCDAAERLLARRRSAGPVPGPPARTPRPGRSRHGLLSVQQRGRGRPHGPG